MAGKAPGKHHRKGITLIEVTRMFPDDEAAEAWFASVRWPDGVVTCPRCESDNVKTGPKHPTMPYRCRPCRKYFSVKTGTAMESSKLGLQVWAMAMYLLSTGLKGTSSMKLHRDIGVTQKTAWHLAHRIRESWDDTPAPFAGPVEVDETFVGGLEKNKPAHKKLRQGTRDRGEDGGGRSEGSRHREGQRGRGDQHRPGDTTAVCCRAHRARCVRVHGRPRGVPRHAWREAPDGAPFGRRVRGRAGTHQRGGELLVDAEARLPRHLPPDEREEHLDRYVGEFTGRHNVRDLDTVHQMAAAARGLVGKRLRYKDLVA